MSAALLMVCTFFVAAPLICIVLALLEVVTELRIHNRKP